MGLYRAKRRFVAALHGIEDHLVRRGVRADHLTLASYPVALASAVALVAGAHVHPVWWLAVAPLSLLRMALNALDGAVARRTGTGHTRGAILNELTDRAADLTTLAAAYLLPIPAALVSAAVIGALAVPFVAVVSQAATGHRLHDGPMGKPDRVLVLSVGAVVAVGTGPTALAWAVGIIAALSVLTLVRRVRHVWALAAAPRRELVDA